MIKRWSAAKLDQCGKLSKWSNKSGSRPLLSGSGHQHLGVVTGRITLVGNVLRQSPTCAGRMNYCRAVMSVTKGRVVAPVLPEARAVFKVGPDDSDCEDTMDGFRDDELMEAHAACWGGLLFHIARIVKLVFSQTGEWVMNHKGSILAAPEQVVSWVSGCFHSQQKHDGVGEGVGCRRVWAVSNIMCNSFWLNFNSYTFSASIWLQTV